MSRLHLGAEMTRDAIQKRIAEITELLKRDDVPHLVRLKLFADREDLREALEKRT